MIYVIQPKSTLNYPKYPEKDRNNFQRRIEKYKIY